jgi:hypothetical protein
MQAVWNAVALGVTQNKLAFWNGIAICDVGNHLPFLWQCTDICPLQPHKMYTATCHYVFGQLHCLHTDQLPLTSKNAWCSAKRRDWLLTQLVFYTLFHWVSSFWHLKGCNSSVFKDQAVFLYLAFEDENTLKTSNGRCHSPSSTVSSFRHVWTLLWEC